MYFAEKSDKTETRSNYQEITNKLRSELACVQDKLVSPKLPRVAREGWSGAGVAVGMSRGRRGVLGFLVSWCLVVFVSSIYVSCVFRFLVFACLVSEFQKFTKLPFHVLR